MPAIGHLRRLRSALPSPLRIEAGPIPRDDLDTGMTFQPGGHSLGAAIRQYLDDAVALKIAQDRAVPLTAPPRPIINTYHPRWRGRLPPGSADQAQQRVATDRHGET